MYWQGFLVVNPRPARRRGFLLMIERPTLAVARADRPAEQPSVLLAWIAVASDQAASTQRLISEQHDRNDSFIATLSCNKPLRSGQRLRSIEILQR
jgi:hypothetical protein